MFNTNQEAPCKFFFERIFSSWERFVIYLHFSRSYIFYLHACIFNLFISSYTCFYLFPPVFTCSLISFSLCRPVISTLWSFYLSFFLYSRVSGIFALLWYIHSQYTLSGECFLFHKSSVFVVFNFLQSIYSYYYLSFECS